MGWAWLLLLLPLLFRGPRLILLAAVGVFSFLTIAVLAVMGGILRSLVFGRGARRKEAGFGPRAAAGPAGAFGFGRKTGAESGPRSRSIPDPDSTFDSTDGTSATSPERSRGRRAGNGRQEADARPYDPRAVVDARFEELE